MGKDKYFVTKSSYFRLYVEGPPKMKDKEFNRNIEKIRPKLIAFANSFINSGAETAEDMVQDAVLKVWKHESQGLERGRKVENWEAFTVVVLRNICLDSLKSKKNKHCPIETKFQLTTNDSPQKNLETKETLKSVAQIMKGLPTDQQMALRLRDVMGYEFEEIAEILDTTEGNIRTLLSRARKQIRDILLK